MTEIVSQTIPNVATQNVVSFNKTAFDDLIYQKGYDVTTERAIPCPCKSEQGENLSTCRNCLGTGWVFIDKKTTKLVLQSINVDTKFKSWSEERAGTVSISARDIDQFSFMDRITVTNSISIIGQILHPKIVSINGSDVLFARTIYDINSILYLYQFSASDEPLTLITDKYALYGNSLNSLSFDIPTFGDIDNLTFSILYKHPIQFHVVDLLHEIRRSQVFDGGMFSEVALPVQAIARRAHYVLDKDDLTGTLLINNA